jgi:hypothetical protein
MKKKKQETTQSGTTNTNTTNTYGYQPGAQSADIDALRNHQFTADPRIGYSYSRQRQQLQDSYNNPLGGYYSPTMRDSQIRAGIASLGQQEAQDYSAANQQLQGQQFAQKATVAGLTAPRLEQTGGSTTGQTSGTGMTTQSGGLLGDILTASAGKPK